MKGYTFENLYIGCEEHFTREITSEMEDYFRIISGDNNPLHQDDSFAKHVGGFSKHVSFGMLTASLYSTIAGMYLPGKYSLIHSLSDVSFKKPVYVGDVLTVNGKVIEKMDALKLIILKVVIKNQNEQTVSTAKMKVICLK